MVYVENDTAKKEKRIFRKKKLTKCVVKPEDLKKPLKSLGLTNKSGGCIISALTDNQIVNHDTKSIFKTSKIFYSNLA